MDIDVFLFVQLFFGSFLIAAITDLVSHEIPNPCSAGLLLSGIARILGGRLSLWEGLMSLVAVGGLLLACSLWRDSLGGGDVKLAGAASFALGLRYSIHALALAFGAALAAMLLRPLWHGKGGAIALAPFLMAGYVLTYLCEV